MQRGRLSCFRYRTAALVGPWRRGPERAAEDAMRARQACSHPNGTLDWQVDGEIEQSFCHPASPCRGVYPPE